MKRIKLKDKISVSLSEDIRNYLSDNISNISNYIEYLIYEDLIKHNAIERKEYYDYEKDM